MAGLTAEGLVIKRLDEIIDDRITSARRYFGNAAKVSVNDVLGRTLRVHAGSEADLWELLELEYNSLHPDFAQDVSLDRIVAYGRITRNESQPSTAQLLMTGDYGITVPQGSYVTSQSTSNRFLTSVDVVFSRSNVVGFVLEVLSYDNSTGQDYTIEIDGETYTTNVIAASESEAAAAIVAGGFNGLDGIATVQVNPDDDTQISVEFDDIFILRNLSIVSSNALSIRQVTKLAPSESEEEGPVAQPAGTLETIGSPVTGWLSVTNPLDAALGNERETDEELRRRFKETKEVNARGSIPAIRSNLRTLIGIEHVEVYENDRNVTDANGLPPHSFSAIVMGGDTVNIAQTIWRVKPAGITSHGNTVVDITDSEGYSHEIAFSRPSEVPVYITVEISAIENSVIPSDVDRDIISELQDYFDTRYTVGDDVVYSRLYTPINRSFEGFQVDALYLGTSASPTGTSNIVIGYDEIATLPRGNVEVIIN